MATPTIVLDNGAATIKVGLHTDAGPRRYPNFACKARGEKFTRYGENLDDVQDITGLSVRRPLDRGYLSNADLQRDIWARIFTHELKVDTTNASLVVTEPPMNLPACQHMLEQIIFEDFNFGSYYAAPGAAFAARHHCSGGGSDASKAGACLVLDLGYSFCHAVPLFDSRILNYGVKRLDFGGKTATNLLKEVVSRRALNVKNEGYIVEMMKEETTFVSQDFVSDLNLAKRSKKTYSVEYVLPNGYNVFRPYVRTAADAEAKGDVTVTKSRSADQEVVLNHERFMIPEVFFTPSDVGIGQAGIAEIAMQSLGCIHESLHPLQLANVLLVGGSAKFRGLEERFARELRALVPVEYDLSIHLPENPEDYAWHGCKLFASSPEYHSRKITKTDYHEHGMSPNQRKLCC